MLFKQTALQNVKSPITSKISKHKSCRCELLFPAAGCIPIDKIRAVSPVVMATRRLPPSPHQPPHRYTTSQRTPMLT
ncbi:unnamed protein product [Danaus chrysippus]|uniref:(African queen) hypothetical protein n=1 Tax=Danaus chrysippus TaxID=151541 RepID=A0A8J2QNW8_9NEOP|nr:unnamed protein product [Danaus chrysippus]